MNSLWKWLIKIILTSGSFFLLVWPFSPKPACWFLRNLFRFGTSVKPKNYRKIHAKTKIVRNLCYSTTHHNCFLDIIAPRTVEEPVPVVFWLHGGAYVAGDKSDVTEYVVQIAAQGYAIVNINYPLAPRAHYPSGVSCVSDAYLFITKHAKEYQLDLSRVYFAGDSAGAQMTAQFVTAQADAEYSNLTQIPQVVPFGDIKGNILLCGLYDVLAYATKFDRHTPITYVIKRIFWGVTGNKQWRTGKEILEGSVLRYVPDIFPPTFITDGNIGTFTNQGLAYADVLDKKGIMVKAIFYPLSKCLLPHEYQFNMRKKESLHTFDCLLEFLNQTKK